MGGVGGVINTQVFKKGGNPSANCLNTVVKINYITKGSKYIFGYYKFKTGQR